jgi:hypothetical protein
MRDAEITAPMPEGASNLLSEPDRAKSTCPPDHESPTIAASQADAITTLWQSVFSFPSLLGALLVGAVATISHTFYVDPDVWWHVKNGQEILATHRWPTQDMYSFSVAGQHWIDAEWIGEVLMAGMYRFGGMRGLELLLFILGSAIVVGLYALATIRSGNSKAAFVATAGLFVLAAVSFNLRPQMLGYLFLVLTLIVLERFRQGKRRALWTLPILMLVWVNAHGSWIIGLGVIGLYLGGGLVGFRMGDIVARRWNPSDRLRLASVLVLCACASLITPYGTALAKFPFQFASSLPVNIANIIEWRPMPFNLPSGKVFLALLLSVIVLQILYRFVWRLEDLALFSLATVMACLHIRFLLIFVPVFAPILATILARWVPRYQRAKDRYLLNATLMAVALAMIIWYFPTQAGLMQNVGKTYPVAAVDYLDHHTVPGPMFNAYGFGGYLVFTRGPEHKVFIDGRGELYEPSGIFADYLKVADIQPGGLSILEKYGIQSCLLEHDAPLATLLAALPGWQRVYEDNTSVLFVRRNPSPALGGRVPRVGSTAGL